MRIETGSVRDLEAIAKLFDAYRQFYRQHPDLAGAQRFIRDRLAKRDSLILVARANSGELVGFTQVYPLYSSVRMRLCWLLNDLYVASDWRKQQVGRALMREAEERARRAGIAVLWLGTEKNNTVAKRLYESIGYTLEAEFDHYELNLT